MIKQPSGAFAITEQGDLGLGLTPINEEVLEDKDKRDKEDKKDKK